MLIEYLLFLLKAITVVIAIVAIVVAIASAKKQDKSDEKLEVEFLNEKLDEFRDDLQQEWLDGKDLKEFKKAKKEKEKQDEDNKSQAPRVFVLDFEGDLDASDTNRLSREIGVLSEILREEDEVVLRLESAGGYVHSYGLAAAELMHLRDSKAKFTVCVDKVAASGGYMMACCANQIFAAPFAIIGSIGVVAEMPNFHKLLQKNSVDYEVLTAGEYKRTLTMFGENTDKARTKFIAELEDTHILFKNFVGKNREGLQVDEVASGEIWYGDKALEKKLVDRIVTSSQYLLERSKEARIYSIGFKHKLSLAEKVSEKFSSVLVKKASLLLSKWRLPLK